MDQPITKRLSLDETVNEHNPPCFIWTTAEDTCVDPTATTRYANSLLLNKIKCECHVFPTGWHGGATCDNRTNQEFGPLKKAGIWMDLATEFLLSL